MPSERNIYNFDFAFTWGLLTVSTKTYEAMHFLTLWNWTQCFAVQDKYDFQGQQNTNISIIRLEDFRPFVCPLCVCPSHSGFPPCILKRCSLESSGQRLTFFVCIFFLNQMFSLLWKKLYLLCLFLTLGVWAFFKDFFKTF